MKFAISGVLLDACVLGLLSSAPAYGYELTQKAQSAVDISESTLYPVLRRLMNEGSLESYDEPYDGRNRRYYKITAAGVRSLEGYAAGWAEYKQVIDAMLIGGAENGRQ